MLFETKEFIGKNGTSYTMRSPAMADAERMLAYLKQTAEETSFGLSYPEELNFTVQDEEAFIANYAEDAGSLMISVFCADDLIGNASLSCIMDRQKVRHRATFGMAILKNHWGQGIGEAVLIELISFAKRAGYEWLELEVAASNSAAVQLYRKLGFAVCGERPCSLKLKNGDYLDELLMTLKL